MCYDEIKDSLTYDPITGLFYWNRSFGRVSAGDCAGNVDSQGYVRIRYGGKAYRAHRLAWMYTYGYFPDGLIDHKDRNKSNNRIENLRLASSENNNYNKSAHHNNKLGIKGVTWDDRYKKYRARVTTKGLLLQNLSDSLDDAVIWLIETRKKNHGEFHCN